MTKAKADQTIGIRIELQKHERDQLETLVVSRAVGNVLTGAGAVLAPFGEVLSVVLGAWIAKEGAEAAAGQFKGWWKGVRDREETKLLEQYGREQPDESYDEWRAGDPGRRLRSIIWGDPEGGPIWWPPFSKE